MILKLMPLTGVDACRAAADLTLVWPVRAGGPALKSVELTKRFPKWADKPSNEERLMMSSSLNQTNTKNNGKYYSRKSNHCVGANRLSEERSVKLVPKLEKKREPTRGSSQGDQFLSI